MLESGSIEEIVCTLVVDKKLSLLGRPFFYLITGSSSPCRIKQGPAVLTQ